MVGGIPERFRTEKGGSVMERERTNDELRGDLVKAMVDRGMPRDMAEELRRQIEDWLPHPLVDFSTRGAEKKEPENKRPNEYEAARKRKEDEQRTKRANRMDLREISGRSRAEHIRAQVAEKYGADPVWEKAR